MKLCTDLNSALSELLLTDNQKQKEYYKLNYTPLVFINNFLYRGNLENMLHLVEDVCMAFESPPDVCSNMNIFREYKSFSVSTIFSFIFFSVLYLGVCFVLVVGVFYLFCRRKMKKKMNDEVSGKINDAIMRYYGQGETASGYQGSSGRIVSGMTEDELKIEAENNVVVCDFKEFNKN